MTRRYCIDGDESGEDHDEDDGGAIMIQAFYFVAGKSSGLSVGTAVAIGFAGLVGLLIIVGVVVYWSKYHRRSRLRAAYYNDISMNDPLYEDFEPEVA